MTIYNFSTRLHTVLNFFTICLELAEIIRIFYFNCLFCLSRVLVANTNNNTHNNSSNGLFNIKYTSIISCLLLICLCNFYCMLNYEHTKLKFDEKKKIKIIPHKFMRMHFVYKDPRKSSRTMNYVRNLIRKFFEPFITLEEGIC